jgi:hypothetical protein
MGEIFKRNAFQNYCLFSLIVDIRTSKVAMRAKTL